MNKRNLSASTQNTGVVVTSTASTGQAVHTAATDPDQMFLWAYNSDSSDVDLTLAFGGTTSNNLLVITIPAGQTYQVLEGQRLGPTLNLRAWAGTTGVINLIGYANSIA